MSFRPDVQIKWEMEFVNSQSAESTYVQAGASRPPFPDPISAIGSVKSRAGGGDPPLTGSRREDRPVVEVAGAQAFEAAGLGLPNRSSMTTTLTRRIAIWLQQYM